MQTEKRYYIQVGLVGNVVLWWGESGKGYTTEFTEAGKYKEDFAKYVTANQLKSKAWLCDYVDKLEKAKKTIIDGQYLDPKKSMKGKRKTTSQPLQ